MVHLLLWEEREDEIEKRYSYIYIIKKNNLI